MWVVGFLFWFFVGFGGFFLLLFVLGFFWLVWVFFHTSPNLVILQKCIILLMKMSCKCCLLLVLTENLFLIFHLTYFLELLTWKLTINNILYVYMKEKTTLADRCSCRYSNTLRGLCSLCGIEYWIAGTLSNLWDAHMQYVWDSFFFF